MSSNIPLMNPEEDKIQDDIGNLQTEKQKASESYSEKLSTFFKYKQNRTIQNKGSCLLVFL